VLKGLLPALGHGQSLLGGEMGTIKKVFEMQMRDGCVVAGFLTFDSGVGAALKITVQGSHGEDVRCSELADAFRGLLEERGARELEEVE
jgi:hypothetical protein